MTLTRREFGKTAAAGVLVLTMIELDGCSSNVFTDIKNWIPVGEAALNSILAALTANGVPITGSVQLLANDVEAALNAVTAAITEYQSVTPAPVGALAKVQTALKAVVDQFTTFMAALQLPGGNIITLISSLAAIVFSTIAAFEGSLPVSLVGAKLAPATFRVGNVTYNVVTHHRTRRAFKRDWNSELDGGKKQGLNVPSIAYMKLSLLDHIPG